MSKELISSSSSGARKISLSETTEFDRGDFSGQIYVAKEDELGFNALLVTVRGRHPRKRMIDTTRTYFVAGGLGTFTLNDEVHSAELGDFFVIPAGSTYEYEGEMELLELNVSPANTFRDEKLE